MKFELKPLFDDISFSRPLLIAGPCSAETETQVLSVARSLNEIGVKIFRAGIWKPRTKPGNFEGVGSVGLKWLRRVKRETGMKTAVEVATASHVRQSLRAGIDLVWIGARTTANPFAVQEVAEALKGSDVAVLVKNPLNPDLEAWIGAIERLQLSGVKRLAAVHRGFSSTGRQAFRNPPEWRLPIELHRRIPGLPIITDPSHIAGKRELVGVVARHAMDIGFDGLMIETHCEPDNAWSDGKQQLTPDMLESLLTSLSDRSDNVEDDSLTSLRLQIDSIDSQIIDLLSRRMGISDRIGEYKRRKGMPVVQLDRYDNLMSRRVEEATELGLSERFIRRILQEIHEESVKRQL